MQTAFWQKNTPSKFTALIGALLYAYNYILSERGNGMKKIMFLGLISTSLLLGGCGNNDSIDDLTDVTANAEEVVESSEPDEKDNISIITKAMEDSYGEFFDVAYDGENTFILSYQTDAEHYNSMQSINSSPKSSDSQLLLTTLGDGLLGFSEKVTELTGEKFSFVISNTDTDEPNFVEVSDGEVSYPVSNLEEKVYAKDEWWEVPNEFKLKINSVTPTDDRNQFSDKEPEQVVIINYTYENLGYESSVQDLFMKPDSVIDNEKTLGEAYPARTGTRPTTVPIGSKLEGAEEAYGLKNSGGTITIIFNQRDTGRNPHTATFEIPITE